MEHMFLFVVLFAFFVTFESIETRQTNHTGNWSRSNGTSSFTHRSNNSSVPYRLSGSAPPARRHGNYSAQNSWNRTIPHQPICTDFWSINSPCRSPDMLQPPIYPGPWWNQADLHPSHDHHGHHKHHGNHTQHGNHTYHGNHTHYGENQTNGRGDRPFETALNGTNATSFATHRQDHREHGYPRDHGHNAQSFNQSTEVHTSSSGLGESQKNGIASGPLGSTINGTNDPFIPNNHEHHGDCEHRGGHRHHHQHGEDHRPFNQSTRLYPSLSGLGEGQNNETASGSIGTILNGTSQTFIPEYHRNHSSASNQHYPFKIDRRISGALSNETTR